MSIEKDSPFGAQLRGTAGQQVDGAKPVVALVELQGI